MGYLDNYDKHKVVVREKLTLAIVEETKVFDHADSWITASINKESLEEKYSADDYDVEIVKVE